MRNLILIALTCLALSCSPKSANDKPQGVLTDTQKKTLEHSKKAEQLLEKADKDRQEQLGEE